jgi:hypothetical protein
MALVDLVDETFVVAAADEVAGRLRDPGWWARWWPNRALVVFMDRGAEGVRWTVTGDLVGTCEVWLERFGDGVIVHYFLRADPTRRGSRTDPITGSPRRLARRSAAVRRQQAGGWKAAMNALKDALEADRSVGTPRTGSRPPTIKNGRRSAEG